MRLYGIKNNSDSSARYPGGEPSEINSSNLHAVGSSHGGIIRGVALWSARRPIWALLVWVLLIGLTVSLSTLIPTRMAGEVDLLNGQSREAAVMARDAGKHNAAEENVLLKRSDGAEINEEQDGAAIEDIRHQLSAASDVESVKDPVPSEDGKSVLITASIEGNPDTASERIEGVHSAVSDFSSHHPEYTMVNTGNATISSDFQTWLGEDLNHATLVTLPITLIILLIVFGAWIVAGLPLLVGLASVFSATGLWAVASQIFPDQGLVSHVILLIGMAVGVDYSLFYVRRFREERAAGYQRLEATHIAAETAGHSVLVSGLAVCLSMAGLLLVQDALSTGAAIGAILVVLVAMVSSLTVLPALLMLLRGAVDRPRVPFVWRLSQGTGGSKFAHRIIGPVGRYPWAALVIMVVLFGALAAPAVSMSLKMTTVDDYPRSLSSMQALDDIREAFPGSKSSANVVLEGEPEQVRQAVDKVTQHAGEDPQTYAGVSNTWTSADQRTAVVDIAVKHTSDSAQAHQAVNRLRSDVAPSLGVSRWAVGGDIASGMDYTQNLSSKIPWVVGIVIAVTFIFMFGAYRSIPLAGITIVLNLASTLAAFGAVTAIFQGTWAENLLGFTSTGHVVSWIPLMLFVILSGLSLDYHILVVSRIREFAAAGYSTQDAIREGITRTAGVITSAAVIMIAVFCVFGGLSFIEMKQIGIGLAFAVLLDATVVRLVFLPALLMVCRRFLWWPSKNIERGIKTSHETLPRS